MSLWLGSHVVELHKILVNIFILELFLPPSLLLLYSRLATSITAASSRTHIHWIDISINFFNHTHSHKSMPFTCNAVSTHKVKYTQNIVAFYIPIYSCDIHVHMCFSNTGRSGSRPPKPTTVTRLSASHPPVVAGTYVCTLSCAYICTNHALVIQSLLYCSCFCMLPRES